MVPKTFCILFYRKFPKEFGGNLKPWNPAGSIALIHPTSPGISSETRAWRFASKLCTDLATPCCTSTYGVTGRLRVGAAEAKLPKIKSLGLGAWGEGLRFGASVFHVRPR